MAELSVREAAGLPSGPRWPQLDQFPPYLFHLITSRLNSRLLERMRPHGVTVPRWRVLMVLMNEDGLAVGELVRLTLIPQSALSRVIDQMERDTLVVRQAAQHDNRVVKVHLTDHGRQVYWKIAPAAEEHAKDTLRSFDARERQQLVSYLHQVLVNLEGPAGSCDPEPDGDERRI